MPFVGCPGLLARPVEECQRRTYARRATTATLRTLSPSELLWPAAVQDVRLNLLHLALPHSSRVSIHMSIPFLIFRSP